MLKAHSRVRRLCSLMGKSGQNPSYLPLEPRELLHNVVLLVTIHLRARRYKMLCTSRFSHESHELISCRTKVGYY